MTTVELTSSRLSPEMDTQPLAATLLLFPMEESRLSTMLTTEMELFRMSPMREFLSMDQLLSRLLLLTQLPMLWLTLLLLLIQLPMLLLTQLPLLTQLLLPTLLPMLLLTLLPLLTQLLMLLPTLSSMVKQQFKNIY